MPSLNKPTLNKPFEFESKKFRVLLNTVIGVVDNLPVTNTPGKVTVLNGEAFMLFKL